MENSKKFMSLAIKEAKKGQYQNWQEPLVGCVITKNGKVLSTGFHEQYGGKHALENAISKVTPKDLDSSTIYLTMEPCDECRKLILQSNCQHLVIAQADPHEVKAHKNSTLIALKSDHTKITSGLLAKEATALNKHYSYYCKTKQPWITLKQNLSLDHHVSPANGKYIKLNSPKVRNYIHRERANYQAIIVGSSTAIIDNPNLFTNSSEGNQPIRIIIDRRGRILNNPGLNLLNNEYPTWIFTQNLNVSHFESLPNTKVFQLQTDQLSEIIDLLKEYGIQSIYVEGGPTLEKAFMDEAYVNEIVDYFSPIYFGSIGLDGAIPIHEFNLDDVSVQKIDDHIRVAGLVR